MIKKFIKRFIFTSFLIYSFNFIAINFNIIIPMNFFSFALIYLFDFNGLLGLVLFKFLFL